MKRISFILLCCMFLTVETVGQNPNLGTAGAQFLQIPVGAQAVAMGGAYVAQARGPLALYWNPAGITQGRTHGFHLSHLCSFQGIQIF